MNDWHNFIGGKWVSGNSSINIENPATGEIFATIAKASLDDLEAAVTAARDCVNSRVLIDCKPAER